MKKAPVVNDKLILGLDVGANSIGWALAYTENNHPIKIARMGVRVFPEGVEGDLATGQEKSRAVKRRESRLHRRQLERQRHRLIRVALLLQGANLLPPGDVKSASKRMEFFASLDRTLFPLEARKEIPHILFYALRGRALDECSEPYELGRAFYHLAQRRGFLSNRRTSRTAGKKDDEEGVVKKKISELEQQILASGARTLGEYFAHLDPTQERIRQRYTSRAMFEEEFEHIWKAQSSYHPTILTSELKKKLQRAIFFQRPLKSAKHLIGQCELEPGCLRAPWALLCAQRFRLYQTLNILQIITPDGSKRPLTEDEREKLAEILELKLSLSWAKIRQLLKLEKNTHFNLEEGGEKGVLGNKTAARLAEAVGEKVWESWCVKKQEQAVTLIRSVHHPKTLARRAKKVLGLDEEAAHRFAVTPLEEGYCSLSRKAIEKVLPLLQKGMPYATARKEIYGEKPGPKPMHFLPRLDNTLEVRNPAVERALTEVRKVVNAVVREYGKPAFIRIELARDLKKNRKDRAKIAQRNRHNQSARAKVAEKIVREVGIKEPKGPDIEKVLLAEECGWHCPYTGKPISMDSLFGEAPQFDVEHIIPLSRCLDNSFFNKTLCEVWENRHRKHNRTPKEAYGSDSDRWEEILHRVKSFQSEAAKEKLARFQQEGALNLDEFTSRQLNDTRYASRLAVEYLGRLYGAGADGVDPEGTRRIQAGRGQVTGYLRAEWGLNLILGAGPEKERSDHRQHAIDAVTVALTEATTVKRLSDAAARAEVSGRRRFAPMEPPWPGFAEEVRRGVEEMIISPRVSRKVNGPFHEETIYSPIKFDAQSKPYVHVRKPLESLSEAEVENIVDPKIRALVQAKLNGGKPDKIFSNPENHPLLQTRSGRLVPIHRVRIRTSQATITLSQGARARQVKLGSNHHVEIIEANDKKGNPRWEGAVVSTLEAMRRLRAGKPVVQRDYGEGKIFQFSLAGGEVIELDGADGQRNLFVIRTISKTQKDYITVEFVTLNDARKKEDIKKDHAWRVKPLESLRKLNCRKLLVTPLGEVRRAGD